MSEFRPQLELASRDMMENVVLSIKFGILERIYSRGSGGFEICSAIAPSARKGARDAVG